MPLAARVLHIFLLVVTVGSSIDASSAAPDRADPGSDALVERTGIVERYLMNEFGDVDGVLADDRTPVRFPPHMSRDLVAALKPADRFVARGRLLPGGGFEAYSLGREGSTPLVESRPTIDDVPLPPRDVRRLALDAMEADGRILVVMRGPAGNADGVVVEDGTIVELPPHSRIVAADALRIGVAIRAQGYGTSNRYGRSLRAERFGFDGQPLVPLQPEGPRLPKPPPPSLPPA